MEGISLGRCKDHLTGELRPYDWKGNITLLKPQNNCTIEDTFYVSISIPEDMYDWQEGSYLDEELLISAKCLILW